MPIGSIYFSWGTSFQPSAEAFALATNTINVKPEKSETYEVGSKWDVLQERLSLRGAVFVIDKTDVRVTDPSNSNQMILGGSQKVSGFELEANGHITEKLQMFAGYAYQDGRTTKAPPGGSPVEGAPLQNVPMHTFHLWSTYDLPRGIQVGGGVNYVSDRIARNTSPYVTVDDYVTIDAMVKYHLTQNVDLQVNGINLTDKFYIDQTHPNHLIPGAGRTFLFTTDFRF